MTLSSNIKYGIFLGTVLSLTACGGGSGSGKSDAENNTNDSAESIKQPDDYPNDSVIMTTLGLNLPEETIRLAELVSQQIQGQSVPLDQSILCINGGNIKWTLQDNDHNQIVSIGDKLVGNFNECSIVNSILRGTVQVDVIAPSSNKPQSIAFSTQSNLQEYNSYNKAWYDLSGGFKAEKTVDAARIQLNLTVDETGFSIQTLTAKKPEKLLNTTIHKTTDLVAGRYTLSINGKVESTILGDMIQISTPTPFEGFLNTYPDKGSLNFKTTMLSSNITANLLTNNASANYTFALNAKKEMTSPELVPWANLINGFMFDNLDETNLINKKMFDYQSNEFSHSLAVTRINGLELLLDDGKYQVNNAQPVITLQFSRPIDTKNLPTIILKQQGIYTDETVALNVRVKGAQLILTPETPLKAGEYNLSIDRDFYDVTGFYHSGFDPISITVPKTLTLSSASSVGAAKTGATVNLTGKATSTFGDAISYKWTQLDGPRVGLQNSETANATFQMPIISVDTAILKFKVTATNRAGFTESSEVSIFGYSNEQNLIALDYISDEGDYIGQGKTAAFAGKNIIRVNSSAQAISFSVDQANDWWTLDLQKAGGGLLKVGQYKNAVRYPFNTNVNGISFSGSGRGCNTLTGSFKVYDVAYDTAGQLLRLSADFTQYCEGGKPALNGRVRYHSAVNF
ncbi:MAG: hypothetical protein EOO69_05490 [Moraxellaceae bacterium]|nr:MAG: hypothetical protein EOO69_05490 [Moraxellaceae bacterium]